MLTYEIYREEQFRRVLEQVYDISRIDLCADDPLQQPDTFFRSNKPLKKSLLFRLPFQFYSNLTFSRAEEECRFFARLEAYSSDNRVNITISSLNELQYANRAIVARNPVLDLADSYGETFGRFSANLRSSLRRNSNKAREHGITISRSDSYGDLKQFYDDVLAAQYVKKHKMVFQPFKLFDLLFSSGMASLFVAKKNEQILGGLLAIEDRDCLHYNWGASNSYQNIAIGTLVINETIKYAIGKGLPKYDFGSTSLADENLHAFKMRWGCVSYPVYQYYTRTAPRVIDLEKSFLFVRKIYGKLSPSLAVRMMPSIVPWLVS